VAPAVSLSELRVEVIYCMVIFVIGVTWGGRAAGFEPFAVLLAVINGILTLSAFHFASLAHVVSRNLADSQVCSRRNGRQLVAGGGFSELLVGLASVEFGAQG
jgi:hypothetical protein